MEKDLSKCNNIYRTLTLWGSQLCWRSGVLWSHRTGSWRTPFGWQHRYNIKCARINNESFILKTITNKKNYEYLKEIYLLLKNEDFLPTLKYFDDKHLIFALTDVGDSLRMYKFKNTSKYNKLYKEFNKQIKNITDKLLNEYDLYHNDLHDDNICVDKNDKIRLIDFELASSNAPLPTGLNTLVLEKAPAIIHLVNGRRGRARKWCAKCAISLMIEEVRPCTCARCKQVYYCSIACQRQHWKTTHKDTCPHPLSRSAQRAAGRDAHT